MYSQNNPLKLGNLPTPEKNQVYDEMHIMNSKFGEPIHLNFNGKYILLNISTAVSLQTWTEDRWADVYHMIYMLQKCENCMLKRGSLLAKH